MMGIAKGNFKSLKLTMVGFVNVSLRIYWCRAGEFKLCGWSKLVPTSETPCTQEVTGFLLFFDSRRRKLNACQVIVDLDLTKLKQTPSDLVEPQLWNMHTSEFLLVTGCALDIRVQGRFLKCAHSNPPLPPVSFPLYPNKSCFSGKRARPLMFLRRGQTCPPGRRRVCIQGTEHFS